MGSLHWIHAPNYKAWSVHPKGTYVSSSIFGEKTGVWKCDKESLRMLQLSRLEWINYLDLYKAFQPLLCLSSNVCLEYFDKQNLRVLQHPRCQWLLVYHIYIYIYIYIAGNTSTFDFPLVCWAIIFMDRWVNTEVMPFSDAFSRCRFL